MRKKDSDSIIETSEVAVPAPDKKAVLPNINEDLCVVRFVSKGRAYFYWKEYGLSLPVADGSCKAGDSIHIAYSGKIGTPDFQFWMKD